jgi:superfamily II DNA or RNA helicase
MTLALRDYQETMVHEARVALRSHRCIVLQSPTGAGKTTTAAAIIEMAVKKGSRVIFAAHLDSLIGDTIERLERCGIWAGRVQANEKRNDLAMAQVCSLQTLHARGKGPPGELLFIDECHRAAAPSVRSVINYYPTSKIIGLTATPIRGDKEPLGDVFEHMVLGPTIPDLIQKGVLSKVRTIAPKYEKSLAMSPLDAIEKWGGWCVIVFGQSIAGSRKFVADWNARRAEMGAPGYEDSAVHVDGEMDLDERRRLLKEFSEGKFRILSNCQMLSEGFDVPRIDTIVFTSAPGHLGAYLQRIGRGMRPSPTTGKTELTFIDLVGSTEIHGLITEPIHWSLDRKTNGTRVEKTGRPRICPNCDTANDPRAWFCEGCEGELPRKVKGAEMIVNPRLIGERGMEKGKIALPSKEDMRADLEYWQAIGIKRDYSPKWAMKQFEVKYGFWPQGKL